MSGCCCESKELKNVKEEFQCSICKKFLPISDIASIKKQRCKKCDDIYNRAKYKKVTRAEKKFLTGNGVRIRYPIPAFKKAYSVYQIDDNKCHKIWGKVQDIALKLEDKSIFDRVMPSRIQRLCYIRDEFNIPIHRGDEAHIYRYKNLHAILTKIAEILINNYKLLLIPDVMNYLYKRTGILIYPNKNIQAELMYYWQKPIKIRLLANIRLLHFLNSGMEIESAVRLVKNIFV